MRSGRFSLPLLPLLLPLLTLVLLPPLSHANLPRTLTITNNCPVTYWFLPTAGAAPFSSPSLSHCSSSFDCIAGSSCLLSPGPALCFWDPPTSSRASFHIPPSSSTLLTFPFIDNGHDVHWSGNLGFCQRGTCGPFPAADTDEVCRDGGCGVYAGPANTVEWTWSKTGTDYYDVSNIAGVNVPLSFGPTPSTQLTHPLAASPYTCGTPGSPSSPYPCSWRFEPPTPFHQWTTASGLPCAADIDCPSPFVCGLTNSPGAESQWSLQCGERLGYWSANSACAAGVDVAGSPFDCSGEVDVLTRCGGGIGSCYQPAATPDCCGCADWHAVLGAASVASTTAACVSTNPAWTERVLPQLVWLKAGAPSAYTYPYDDMSSTFICSAKDGHLNHVDYQVTLCP